MSQKVNLYSRPGAQFGTVEIIHNGNVVAHSAPGVYPSDLTQFLDLIRAIDQRSLDPEPIGTYDCPKCGAGIDIDLLIGGSQE